MTRVKSLLCIPTAKEINRLVASTDSPWEVGNGISTSKSPGRSSSARQRSGPPGQDEGSLACFDRGPALLDLLVLRVWKV